MKLERLDESGLMIAKASAILKILGGRGCAVYNGQTAVYYSGEKVAHPTPDLLVIVFCKSRLGEQTTSLLVV